MQKVKQNLLPIFRKFSRPAAPDRIRHRGIGCTGERLQRGPVSPNVIIPGRREVHAESRPNSAARRCATARALRACARSCWPTRRGGWSWCRPRASGTRPTIRSRIFCISAMRTCSMSVSCWDLWRRSRRPLPRDPRRLRADAAHRGGARGDLRRHATAARRGTGSSRGANISRRG